MKIKHVRKWLVSIGLLLMFLIGFYLFKTHEYNFKQTEQFVCTGGGNLLHVTTVYSKTPSKKYIVFVHGDGPKNATDEGMYYPIWHEMTKLGWNVVSWDKPGIGESRGNWLNQTMEDRVRETVHLVQHLEEAEEIILWGSDQAGWVIPAALEQSKATEAVVINPSINWLQQQQYAMTHEKHQKMTKKESERRMTDMKHNDYEAYVENGGHLTRSRFHFERQNLQADATEDLKKLTKPLTVIGGMQDETTNMKETMQTYQKLVDESLLTAYEIEYADRHMIPTYYNTVRRWVKMYFTPKSLYHREYFEIMERILTV